MHGHEVIGWAEDLDVSGSVDPFDTPSLGPWLTQERAGEWDILCAWKLDRVGRRAIPLNKMFGWIMDNHKILVCVSDNIDLSTWVGRLVANVIAGVAEGELEAIRERTKASRRKLLETGRWPGGPVPYGLAAKPLDGGGWVLQQDPETAPVVRRIVQQIIEGQPVLAVVDQLNSDGVKAPKAARWNTKTVWNLVTSKTLLGHATYEGKTVRDNRGVPVLNAAPLLPQDEWDRLQVAVEKRKITPSRVRKTSPLLGVLLCYKCGSPLHHRVFTKPNSVYRYYLCQGNHTDPVKSEMVESELEAAFLAAVGNKNVLERVFIPAEDHQIELDEARRAVDELATLMGTMTSDSVRSRLTEQIRAIDFRISELEKLPSRSAGWEYKETGETYQNLWENSDTENRRQLLLRSGITYRVMRYPGTQAVKAELYIPDEMLERLNNARQTPVNTKNPPDDV